MSGALEWFVAEGSAGFTSDPDQAKKSRNGNPIACPGGLNQVWKAHFRRDRMRLNQVWELLFDAYETLLEQPEDAGFQALCRGYTKALAILEYGDDSEENYQKAKQRLLAEFK